MTLSTRVPYAGRIRNRCESRADQRVKRLAVTPVYNVLGVDGLGMFIAVAEQSAFAELEVRDERDPFRLLFTRDAKGFFQSCAHPISRCTTSTSTA